MAENKIDLMELFISILFVLSSLNVIQSVNAK